jgi:NADPH-dependent glutamate synthase beta subunit-like oxidoreductase
MTEVKGSDPTFRVEVPDIDYWKCQIKCQNACPVQTDARGYVRAIAERDYRRAYRIARGPNPLASICGRICGAPCEAACRRGTLDRPIAIRALKRFVCEQHGVESYPDDPLGAIDESMGRVVEAELTNAAFEEIQHLLTHLRRGPFDRPSGKRVAIIGSGPAGLAAAHDLAVHGIQPVVYEMETVEAGMLHLGVPAYRLPRQVIRAEVEVIRELGTEFRLGITVGKDVSLEELRQEFSAVLIAVGAKRSRGLPIENIDAPGVVGGVEFLRSVALREPIPLGRNVVVIGGGNVAYDVARTVMRQESYDVAVTARKRPGVEKVHLCALESLEEMPADEIEIREAEEEGIYRHNSVGPHQILLDNEGLFSGVVFKRCVRVFDDAGRFSPQFDETDLWTLTGDTLLLSVGQRVSFDFIDPERDRIRLTERGFVDTDPETGQSRTAADIFVAGDCAHGPSLAIHAIASGKKAARGIFSFVTGRSITQEDFEAHHHIADYFREADYEKIARIQLPSLSVSERRASFSKPVELPLSEDQAVREASRCFDCGVNTIFDGEKCILCGGCVDVCPTFCLKLVPMEEISGEHVEQLSQAINGQEEEYLSAIIKDEEPCIRCGLCAERCPTGAITMEKFLFKEAWVERQADSA